MAKLQGNTIAGWIKDTVLELMGSPAPTSTMNSPGLTVHVDDPLGMMQGKPRMVRINDLDYRDIDFELAKARWVTQHINGQEYPFIDYFLKGIDRKGAITRIVLRYIPREDGDSRYTHSISLLQLTDEIGADETDKFNGLMEALAEEEDGTGKFVLSDDETNITENYYRQDKVHTPLRASVVDYTDGKMAPGGNIKLWDYRASMKDEGGTDVVRVLVVEQNVQTKFVEIYKGLLIVPEKVLN